MTPLLLPQNLLNDRAASPTRSSLAFSSEMLEAIRSDRDESSKGKPHQTFREHEQGLNGKEGDLIPINDITPHSSRLEIKVDHTFSSPIPPPTHWSAIQDTTPPSQAQPEPRQSSSSSYTAQQQPPTPYQAVPHQYPSNQRDPVSTQISGCPSPRITASHSPVQPLSTSNIR